MKEEDCQGEHWSPGEMQRKTQCSFATPQQTQREKGSGALCCHITSLHGSKYGARLHGLFPPLQSALTPKGILSVHSCPLFLFMEKAITQHTFRTVEGTWASLNATQPSLSLKKMHEQFSVPRYSKQNKTKALRSTSRTTHSRRNGYFSKRRDHH